MSFFYEDGTDNPTSKTPNLQDQGLSLSLSQFTWHLPSTLPTSRLPLVIAFKFTGTHPCPYPAQLYLQQGGGIIHWATLVLPLLTLYTHSYTFLHIVPTLFCESQRIWAVLTTKFDYNTLSTNSATGKQIQNFYTFSVQSLTLPDDTPMTAHC
jgi:hypothetical protein